MITVTVSSVLQKLDVWLDRLQVPPHRQLCALLPQYNLCGEDDAVLYLAHWLRYPCKVGKAS
ncbi:hypothetical protein EME01_62780 [Sinorhizobium meliloti]|nr:hypothetical protein EME01_62780 [Sinorhizobium meliloti]